MSSAIYFLKCFRICNYIETNQQIFFYIVVLLFVISLNINVNLISNLIYFLKKLVDFIQDKLVEDTFIICSRFKDTKVNTKL